MDNSVDRCAIVLGDPVPWFAAPLIGDGSFNLSVAAGRWIVLSFLGSPANPRVEHELTELFRSSHLFDEDRIVFYGIFTAPPDDPAPFSNAAHRRRRSSPTMMARSVARSAPAKCRIRSCLIRCCAP